MKGGGRSCCVVGCRNRTTAPQGKHFYKFPKKQPYRDVWISFTRRGSDYEVKEHSTICQDHFHPSCFSYKKKQVRLLNESVPTVFDRQTSNGIEEIVLTFDSHVMHYREAESLLNPAYDKEKHESELIKKQAQRLADVKRSCRFCFEDSFEDDKDFVEISKLKNYSIRPDDVFKLIGLSTQHNNQFSKVMCEECFQTIITFDGYKKRCCKTYEAILVELKDLEQSLQKVRGAPVDSNSWLKSKEIWDDVDDFNNDDFENESDDFSSTAVQEAKPSFQKVIIKEETKDEPMLDDEFLIPTIEVNDDINDPDFLLPILKVISEDKTDNSDCENIEYSVDEEAIDQTPPTPGPLFKDIYNPSDVSNVIKDHERQIFATRIYECFFCRMVSLQRKLSSSCASINSRIYFNRNSLERKLSNITTAR